MICNDYSFMREINISCRLRYEGMKNMTHLVLEYYIDAILFVMAIVKGKFKFD